MPFLSLYSKVYCPLKPNVLYIYIYIVYQVNLKAYAYVLLIIRNDRKNKFHKLTFYSKNGS